MSATTRRVSRKRARTAEEVVQEPTPPTEASSASRRPKRKAPAREEDREDGYENLKQADASPRPPEKPRKDAHAPDSPQVISEPPSQILAVMGFGVHEFGELGLGPKSTKVRRPRLNPFLDPDDKDSFRVVQIDCGGMHTVALTADNKIISWGVNDNGALGRDTKWDDDSDSASASGGADLNPLESTPAAISPSHFPPGTRFGQVAAGDSCSFALTTTGLVYGWGTFVNSQGQPCFGYIDDGQETVKIQPTPILVSGLKDVVQITCGANHAVALDKHGCVWTWGVDEQNQLGRHSFGRHRKDPLRPQQVSVCSGRAKLVASGQFHSFAVDSRGAVWSWGLNNCGQTGHPHLSDDNIHTSLPHPVKIRSLQGRRIAVIDGSNFHSVAVTDEGEFLVWGRLDAGQLGIRFTDAHLNDPALIHRDEAGRPRICLRPMSVSDIGKAVYACCGSQHTVFVNTDGVAFSTGFGPNGQLGLGPDVEEVDVPQQIINRAVTDRKLIWAGAGGQFSMVAAPASGVTSGTGTRNETD